MVVAAGSTCSAPLGLTLPIAGCIVTVVAPETSQLKVADCPELIVSGVAVKELMTGWAASVDGGGGAGPSGAVMVMHPAAGLISTTSGSISKVKYHLYFFMLVLPPLFLEPLTRLVAVLELANYSIQLSGIQLKRLPKPETPSTKSEILNNI